MEKDYSDLIEKLQKCKGIGELIREIENNRDIIDESFLALLDAKIEDSMKEEPKVSASLAYISRVMDNLKIRENLSQDKQKNMDISGDFIHEKGEKSTGSLSSNINTADISHDYIKGCDKESTAPAERKDKKQKKNTGGYVNHSLLEKEFGYKKNTAGTDKKPSSPPLKKIDYLPDGNIKIELETTFESFLFTLFACAFLSIFIVIGLYIMEEGKLPKVYIYGSIIITVITYLLRMATNNHYFIDMKKKALIYHFEFMGIKMNFQKLLLADIRSVSIEMTTRETYKNKQLVRWEEYCIIFIMVNGKKLRISDWEKKEKYDEYVATAQELADILQIEYKR